MKSNEELYKCVNDIQYFSKHYTNYSLSEELDRTVKNLIKSDMDNLLNLRWKRILEFLPES